MELWERIKTYLSFEKEEILHLIVAALVIGFVFAFRSWSFGNFIISIFIVLLSFLFHIVAQKITGLNWGYKVQFKVWWAGLLVALIFVFASNGKFWWLILPGGISLSLLAGLRLGRFRYGLNYSTMSNVTLVGPLASLILATIFKQIDIWFLGNSSVIFHNIFIFNLAYAACQMLPIPPLDGHYIIYASRLWYAFLFGTIITYTILAVTFTLYSWLIALTAGGLVWLVYYLGFEKTAWKS